MLTGRVRNSEGRNETAPQASLAAPGRWAHTIAVACYPVNADWKPSLKRRQGLPRSQQRRASALGEDNRHLTQAPISEQPQRLENIRILVNPEFRVGRNPEETLGNRVLAHFALDTGFR